MAFDANSTFDPVAQGLPNRGTREDSIETHVQNAGLVTYLFLPCGGIFARKNVVSVRQLFYVPADFTRKSCTKRSLYQCGRWVA